ncbi:hypothetical protein MAR_ORF105 [Marseillevirus marseillevirus]|uniref:Uncharacterized protein n=1 Tax=Marseillevirus marseillevirus TaxID=694581 RepID=D2XAB3_GBMV|nr:hypothetical protein MAR_ORF105 [Marseillevirus marseillevirus]ADB03890.1 hypothetical protein MAR_ORF105 [Marseillevirus marseillevirus]
MKTMSLLAFQTKKTMKSVLLPRVYQLLKEEFLIEKEEVNVSVSPLYIRAECCTSISIELSGKSVCEWREWEGRDGETIYGAIGEYDVNTVAEALEIVREQCSGIRHILIEKHKNISLEKEKLLGEIERLRKKNRKLRYAPGGKGALRAEKHFETLRS